MRGGNFEIEIKEDLCKERVPKLPFLCTHSARGTYCGKGLVVKDTVGYTLIDLGEKINGGWYNTVFTKSSLSDLMEIADIEPKEGKVIIYE